MEEAGGAKPKWKDRVKNEMSSWLNLISSTNKGGMSNEFFDLIKNIGEARSKQVIPPVFFWCSTI